MLTIKQKSVLNAISEYIEDKGISPTVRELADKVGLKSTSTMQGHLNRLVEQGYITKHPACPRTIRIIKSSS